MPYFFTSESVSEGHPDKVADQISDAILDAYLAHDPSAKVACETFVTTGLVVIGGETKIKSEAKRFIDEEEIARATIEKIGYTKSDYQFDYKSCAVIRTLHSQSPDINQGVERAVEEEQGAGDQGMMFGYACKETDTYMPLALELSHIILRELAAIRKAGTEMTYLRPDAKSQVTIQYNDDHTALKVDTVVLSTQHDDFADEPTMLAAIAKDVINIVMPRVIASLPERVKALFGTDIKYHINPTGKFVIGGPHGDTGLTGRKIIVDTYGGKGAHGGGAFSGKDSSKVDRSAAYAMRHIAKNLVAAGVANEVLTQVAYAIGVAEPVGIFINTYGTANVDLTDGKIAEIVQKTIDLRPRAIVNRLGLTNPIFSETAAYGHMGRTPGTKIVQVLENGSLVTKEVETFTWEKLDLVDTLKQAFSIA